MKTQNREFRCTIYLSKDTAELLHKFADDDMREFHLQASFMLEGAIKKRDEESQIEQMSKKLDKELNKL